MGGEPVAPLTENPADPTLARSGPSVDLPLPGPRPGRGAHAEPGSVTDERYADERYADERYADERYADERYADERYPGVPPAPRPPARAKRVRRYRLRGRHARERGHLRVPVSLSVVPHVGIAEDWLVLQVLRRHAVADLDSAQVSALSALPPSVAVPSLDRLVRLGLVRRHVVAGHERFGVL